MFPNLIALIIALLPTYQIRFHLFGIPMTLLEVMILLIFVLWVSTSLRGAKRRDNLSVSLKIPTPLLIITSIFLLSAFIAIFIAPDHRAALGIFKAYFIEPLLLAVVALDTIKTKKDIEKIILGFAISAFYISLYAIFQKFTGYGIPGPWILERRVTSVFPYPNAIGLYLAPLIPLFISQTIHNIIPSTTSQSHVILSEAKRSRRIPHAFSTIFFSATTLLSLIAIYLAKTEAALGALGIVLLVWLFISKIRFAKPISISIGAIGLITLFAIPSLSQKLLLHDWSGTVRRITWNETWTMLKDHPVFGAGLSGYPATFRPYHHRSFEIFQYPHTLIFNFWSEIGIVGLLAFFSLIAFFFKRASHDWKNSIFSQSLVAAMIILFLHGLVDVPYFKNDLAIIFWFLFVFLLANKKTVMTSS